MTLTSLRGVGVAFFSASDTRRGSWPHKDSHAAANAVLSLSSRDSSTRAVICNIVKPAGHGLMSRAFHGTNLLHGRVTKRLHSKLRRVCASAKVSLANPIVTRLIDSWVPERLPTPQQCR